MTAARQWRRLASATWVTAGIGLVATSCSFFFELDADQCSIDADCEKFEGDLPVCEAGLCVAKSPPSGGNGGSSTAGGATVPGEAGAGGGGAPAETGCKSNAECTDDFEPHVCIAGECVGLITDECPLVIGEENLQAEEPIIFGAYTLVNATEKSVASRNIDLVVKEFTREVTGLPGPNGSDRTLAFVVCNSSFPEVAPGTIGPFEPSLAHLVDTLHVPGILSGLSAKDLEAVFSQRLNDAGTFVISPYEQDSELAAFSDGGRLWHLLGATEDLAPTFGALLKRTEQYLRGNAAFFLNLAAEDDPLRVAIVTANIARETDVRKALVELGVLGDFDVQQFSIDSALLTNSPETAPVANALLAYAPHIIVALAGSEFIEGIFPVLEGETWGAVGEPTRNQSRPMYVLGSTMGPQTWSWYSTNQGEPGGYGTLLDRIVGVTYESAEDTELLEDYTTRLLLENDDLPDPSILVGSENVYDAAYLLIYAAAGAGEVPELNGTEMSRGMRLLLDGERYDIGPGDQMTSIITTVARGDQVGLRLTLGEPNWNAARGTRKGRGSVYCLNDQDPGIERDLFPQGPNLDVLRYDPETNTLHDPEDKTLEGTLQCIAGF